VEAMRNEAFLFHFLISFCFVWTRASLARCLFMGVNFDIISKVMLRMAVLDVRRIDSDGKYFTVIMGQCVWWSRQDRWRPRVEWLTEHLGDGEADLVWMKFKFD
jgi:hypothetical protein